MTKHTRSRLVTVFLVVVLVALFAVCFVVGTRSQAGSEEKFGGSDDAATTAIQQSAPGYQPWAHSLFEPASGEVESGLFAMQAAIGGTVLGFALGGLWGRRKAEREFNNAAPAGSPGLVVPSEEPGDTRTHAS